MVGVATNGQILKVTSLSGSWMECALGDDEEAVFLHSSSWKAIAQLSDGTEARLSAERTWREQTTNLDHDTYY